MNFDSSTFFIFLTSEPTKEKITKCLLTSEIKRRLIFQSLPSRNYHRPFTHPLIFSTFRSEKKKERCVRIIRNIFLFPREEKITSDILGRSIENLKKKKFFSSSVRKRGAENLKCPILEKLREEKERESNVFSKRGARDREENVYVGRTLRWFFGTKVLSCTRVRELFSPRGMGNLLLLGAGKLLIFFFSLFYFLLLFFLTKHSARTF